MEAPFALVGCVLTAKPAAEAIDAFVAQARRERAVIMSKSAQGATFVRFNATDGRLVALARQATFGRARPALRFGFVAGTRETLTATSEGAAKRGAAAGPGTGSAEGGVSLSARSIVHAHQLAAGAADGQVLVSGPLAVRLIEEGFALRSRPVRLPGGQRLAACVLEPDATAATAAPPDTTDRAATSAKAAGSDDTAGATSASTQAASLGQVLQALQTQTEAVTLRQQDLEARQDAALARMTLVEEGTRPSRHLAELEAEVEVQLTRAESRLTFIDQLEQRLERLHAAAAELDHRISEQLRRQAEADRLRQQCDELEARMASAQGRLGDLAASQQELAERAPQIDALVGRIGQAEAEIERVASRRPLVEDVRSQADALTHMLGDIDLKLERLSEQRAMIDDAGERLARLEYTLREAQNTLRALQREREMAERIERGLKALRSRRGASEAT